MNYNKRLVRTGALAVAVTIAFGLFAYKAAEWSKGLNSEFLVLGQSGGSGGGSTGGTGTESTTAKVIPQVAVGSFDGGLTKYVTVIQVVNTGSSAITVTGNFYKEDGTASTLPLATNLTTTATFTGTLPSVNLAGNQVLVISGGTTTATTPSPGAIGWGKITTTGNVSIATFFELRDGATSVLYSRVGVTASPADMLQFVIPRVRDAAAGLDVAFALVNTGSVAASFTATLKDANGATIATKMDSLAAGRHVALFTREYFSLTNEPAGRNYHYITFSSLSASFAAIALAFEGGTQTSFPVDRLQ